LKLLLDTSVWSLAMRRDQSEGHPSVDFLADALRHEGSIFTTGLILQEILQGFSGPEARKQILDRFTPLPLIVPQREDHTAAADLRNDFSPPRPPDRHDRCAPGPTLHPLRARHVEHGQGFRAPRPDSASPPLGDVASIESSFDSIDSILGHTFALRIYAVPYISFCRITAV
jgi:hypothetical protein